MASIIKVDQIQESTTGVGTNFSTTGSATTPTISLGNQTNKGFYHAGSDKIGIAIGGSKVGEIGNGYGGFTGSVIYVARKQITPVDFSVNAIIPRDTTIPLITEGSSVVQVNYTPKIISSSILIQANFWIGETANVTNKITSALFINDVCIHVQSHGSKDTTVDISTVFMQSWITHNGTTLDIEIRSDSLNGISINPQSTSTSGDTSYASGTTRFGGSVSNSELIIWEIMSENL